MLDFYRWHVSSLSTTNLVATMLDMVVVDISRKVERHCWDFYGMILQPFWLLPGITNLVEISDGFRWCVVFISSTHPDLDLHMCGRQSKLFPSSNHLGGFSFQVKNLNRGQLHERKVIKALDLFPSSVPPGWPVRWPRIRTSIEVNKPHVDFKWDHLMSIQCAPGPSFFPMSVGFVFSNISSKIFDCIVKIKMPYTMISQLCWEVQDIAIA